MSTATATQLDAPDVERLHDGQLLARVAAGGDDDCFAEVVERHAALVLAACRRQLGDGGDAEDAAQAVFLVLWKKARSLRRKRSVAAWLHRVARNVCRNARRARAARQRREREAAQMNEPSRNEDNAWHEIKDILDEELDRLPEKYRLPVILFHLEEHSLEEIAELLGTKASTIGTRLTRGRERLRGRLARQGITIALAGLLTTLAANITSAAVPATFVTATTRAATLFAAGKLAAGGVVTAKTAALAKGTMNMLTIAKLKMAAAVMATATAVTTTTSVVVYQAVQAEAQAPMPTVVLPEKEMPLRLVYAYDRVQHRGEEDGSKLHLVDMPLATAARLPENVWRTMSSHVTNSKIALESPAAGKDVGVLLVSPLLETGKFWRPARVHRDGKNIALVVESWNDNQVRKTKNLPRQSMYFVSLGKLEAGAYTLTLHLRDMYCDFDKSDDPHYIERTIETASTRLHIDEPGGERDKDGDVSLPSIAAEDLVSLPGSGKAFQMATGEPPKDVDAKVNPYVAVGRPAEAIRYSERRDDVLMGAMIAADTIRVDSYPNTKVFNWATAASQPPTEGLPVWLQVAGPHTGLKDELSVREIEWVKDKKVVIRLDCWRSDRDEHRSACRQGVAFLPLMRGLLPIRDPGDYEVQVEWNIWYDKQGQTFTRCTAKEIDKAHVPDNKKDEFRELLSRKATHKFTLAAAEARVGWADPTARSLELLKMDKRTFHLTLKRLLPDDKPDEIWLAVVQQSPPPQSGAQATYYLETEQIEKLIDALGDKGFLRAGTAGEAALREDTPWILRIGNAEFVQHQIFADDKQAEKERAALLTIIAQATGDDNALGDAAKQAKRGASGDGDYTFGEGDQVQVGIDVVGQILSFALKNAGKRPCRIMSHVSTHERHYDNLTLHIVDSKDATTKIHFVDSRDRSGPIFVDVKPGDLHQDAINLSEWFVRRHINLSPKDGAVYRLYLTYDASQFANSSRAKKGTAPFAAGPVRSGIVTVKYQADKGFASFTTDDEP